MPLATLVIPAPKQNTSIVSQALLENGDPAADTLVILYRDDIPIATDVTDSAGIYSFENLIEGNYRVEVEIGDGSPTLLVDYSEIGGAVTENVSLDHITPAELEVVIENGETNVAIVSGGSGYSNKVKPQIVTDDGYVGEAVVNDQGTITSILTVSLGEGTSSTASIYTAAIKPPFLGTTIVGSPSQPGDPDNSQAAYAAWTSAINSYAESDAAAVDAFESIIAVRGGYGSSPYQNWYAPPTGNADFHNACIQVANGPCTVSGNQIFNLSCVSTYPTSKIRVYFNNPDFSGIKMTALSGTGPDYLEFQKYEVKWIDYSSGATNLATGLQASGPPTAGRRFYLNPPPPTGTYPPLVCGTQLSYAAFLANQSEFLTNINPNRIKQGSIPLKNDLPESIKSILDFLGIADIGFLSLIRYIRNYSTYSALQLVADQRATQQIKDAEVLYGKNSIEYGIAKKQAFQELNSAKGYLANEFIVKPVLNLLAEKTAFNLSVIDALRGLPSSSTRSEIVNEISPYITTAINIGYQIYGSKELSVLVGIGSFAFGSASLGSSLLLGSLAKNGTQSVPKAVDDLIQQTNGIYTQPSWLNGTSYDTVNLFNNLEGYRVTFSNGSYVTTNIPAPQDELRPYMWDPDQNKFVPNPGFTG